MSSQLPPAATKAGGMRLPAPYKGHAKDDDSPATPQTNVEQALSAQSQQEILADALGIPLENETPAVRDASQHPKANASTYTPSSNKVQNQQVHEKHRSNAGHNQQVQQPGGAYGSHRH